MLIGRAECRTFCIYRSKVASWLQKIRTNLPPKCPLNLDEEFDRVLSAGAVSILNTSVYPLLLYVVALVGHDEITNIYAM